MLVGSTKTLRRYRNPTVKQKLQERAQYQESLQAEAERAYLAFLAEVAEEHYGILRDAVNKLAIADCVLSLAVVAAQEGYVKPEFVDEDVLEIEEGRHPMVEAIRPDPFVPNTVKMGGGSPRSKVITGAFHRICLQVRGIETYRRSEYGRKVIVCANDRAHR
jgi:DNA mismatch repair protein MSH3